MADVYKRLNTVQTVTSSGTVVYTVPGSTTALIKKIVVSNNAAPTATVKIYHGTAADANVILPTTTLLQNEYGVDDAPFALSAGEVITVDGTGTVNIQVYGLEVS